MMSFPQKLLEELTCPLCWKSQKSMDELLKHLKSGHSSNMFKCKQCQTVGWNVENLLKHIAESHDKSVTLVDALQNCVTVPDR